MFLPSEFSLHKEFDVPDIESQKWVLSFFFEQCSEKFSSKVAKKKKKSSPAGEVAFIPIAFSAHDGGAIVCRCHPGALGTAFYGVSQPSF